MSSATLPTRPTSSSRTRIKPQTQGSHLIIHETRRSSVDELRRKIQQAMLQRAGQSLRAVNVQIHEGLVRLSGQVLSYYQKQLATVAVLSVDGVEQLHNDLKVATGRAPHAHS
ncbi:MAG: osmotically-inducible protein OsmY [Planctomycetaceae bacterium]|jgi:osmotically-inducible protein OsmY